VHPTLYSGGNTFFPVKKETTSEEATLKNVDAIMQRKTRKIKKMMQLVLIWRTYC